jgi:hypothetical protein
MKKLFTILVVIFLAQASFSQTLLLEEFSGSAWPPAGWSFDGLPAQWAKSATAAAGGTAPEAKFTYTNQNTTTRFITPAFDLSSHNNVTLSFKYFYDWYANGVTFGVAKRFGTGAWEVAWSVNPTGNQGPKSQTVEFTNVGQADFQFCFYLTGNLYNMDYLHLDDVKLFVRQNLDAGLQTMAVPSYFLEAQTVTGKVINEGLTSLNSFDVNWSLNDGEVNTTSYTGLNLATDATFNYSCTQPLNPPAGLHTLKVWVSNVNGVAVDDNPDNDMITKNIGVPTQTLQRRPLFEEFTSSTCAPCASFNNSVFNPFINQYGDNIGLIKYQMNWPGSGDPYYTAEGGVRRNYYGVSAVPMLYAEGKNVATSSAAVNNAYTTGMADPAFVTLSGSHEVNGNNFTVIANITPYVALTNATVHIVVIEKITTGNVASNGETSFKHVMMKMLPDANGTTMNMEAGVTTTLNFSHDMATTNVEEMEDLIAVIFIQDNSTKYVFQSVYTEEAGSVAALVSFDPVAGTTGVTTEADLHVSFDMPVFLVGGSDITNDNVAALITLKQVNGADFPFTASINDEKTVITVNPDGLLNSYTNYELGIADIQNANAVVSPASSTTFETGMHVGVNEIAAGIIGITPNPAKDEMQIRYFLSETGNVEITLHDLSGRQVKNIFNGNVISGQQNLTWNASELPAGAYIVRMQTQRTVNTIRLVVNN